MVPPVNAERLQEIPGSEPVVPPPPGAVVASGFTSDLLSDVMAHAAEDAVLITIQAHANAVAVATLSGVRAILVCAARPIPGDMAAAARQHGIGLFRTHLNQFDASVAVHNLLYAP